MKVLELPFQNKDNLFSAYLKGNSDVGSLFDYNPFENESYIDRWKDLQERTFPRTALYNHLTSYHQSLPAESKTFDNIEKLKDPKSTVVVTGQQAGLLTGPLYTIHKCLSTILFAQEKERQLGTPVVPVFWIAGEDHDFDEINHIHIPIDGQLKKYKLNLYEGMRSVSHIEVDEDLLFPWAEEVIRSFGETEHTQKLKDLIQKAIKESDTLTGFFAYLMVALYSDFGLVILDSHHPDLRRIETPFFESMIRKNEKIDEAFQNGLANVNNLGHASPIESEEGSAHLFIEERDTRVLLIRENSSFRGKNNECLYNEEELLNIAQTTPSRLSNNVITRPLMQELLLPTLAFVGGPGEINYWSALKPVFHAFDMKMPPVLPRLSLVLLDRYTQKTIEEKELDPVQVVFNGVLDEKDKWLADNTDYDLDEEIGHVLEVFKKGHDNLGKTAHDIDRGLDRLTEKNWSIIEDQILFLKQKMEKSIYQRHEVELKKFDHIQMHLLPDDQPQERILNVFYFINQIGFEFISELATQYYLWNGNPKAIKL
ncbi:bacillithiol biosynthesis cysteine-adding enzyme BshC [Pseudalkalibacillus salsuginis]|uniref:bacillithiol biosynthesis cysteine-adding enzyme BshC n=1 Tax=Pseudalkalibacillus salsuginis TaxID=2910972 RepID=UPI001F3EC718|nr:bacillithiol biosynthesis cysteine-adding enzyme BshC [Pseudalkalibacillus salsuginis]MCF6410461.1 bacillithiol biosynthesis cysteine-adding enzyme BshC [Pseudalkalibacillus salsuginis]